MTYIPIRDVQGRDCGVVAITVNGDLWYYERERDVPVNHDGTARHMLPVTPDAMLSAVAEALADVTGITNAAALLARAMSEVARARCA